MSNKYLYVKLFDKFIRDKIRYKKATYMGFALTYKL